MAALRRLAIERIRRIGVAGLAVCALGTPTAAAAQAAGAGEIAVVVHPSTPIDSLSLTELRRIFLGEQQFWRDLTRIVLFIHPPGSAEREAVLRLVYRMTEPDFRRYWITKVFRAEVAAGPKIVYNSDMAQRLVAAIPGTIALLPAREVNASLRVVRIDGHLPGEEGYPLR